MGIYFDKVTHKYTSFAKDFYSALNEVTLRIEEHGEFIALVGHTGSGKSTLAKHMNALLFPTSGSVEIFGKTVTAKRDKRISYNDLRKKVGLVFQFPEYQLFEETIEKDIMFGPINFKVPLEDAKKLARESLALVGLDESYLKRNPFNLSGGEKKRVSIAGILALDPNILVLDEPTSGLDPHGREILMNLFRDIHEKTGKSVIIITHDMDLVYKYFNRVIVLNEGRLTFDGTPDQLFKSDILGENHLDLPTSVKIMKYLKEKTGMDIDIHQKSTDDIVNELKRIDNS